MEEKRAWPVNVTIAGVISGFHGLARVFVITCLDDCDAFPLCRTHLSLNHAPFIRPRASEQRLLTQSRSVKVRDCTHGTFHGDLKTL